MFETYLATRVEEKDEHNKKLTDGLRHYDASDRGDIVTPPSRVDGTDELAKDIME